MKQNSEIKTILQATFQKLDEKVDDRVPVKQLCKNVITGKLFGDKGYIKKGLTQWLADNINVSLITKIRKNMTRKEM